MTVLSLASVLDLPAAVPLHAVLLAHRGDDLDVDCANVERIGGLCLQLLMSARLTWRLDHKRFRMINVSEPCRDALSLAQANAVLGLEE